MKPRSFYSLLMIGLSLMLFNSLSAQIQFFRPVNKDGINVFEAPKEQGEEFDGVKVRVGGAFALQYQALKHENENPTAATANNLYKLGSGFNLATANLNLDVQLADGIRLNLENYMSSRHHNEFWVKGGYIQIDKLPMFGNPEWFTKYVRVKLGHMQPNYGDQMMRRTDNGNAIYNPFVGNYIMDAFTTEVGGEAYIFPVKGISLMLGLTNGFINYNQIKYADEPESGNLEPTKKNPSLYLKGAFDKNITEDFRFRLSASMVTNSSTQRNTLYGGDRTGSRYYWVLEPTTATLTANAFSGRFNPGFTNNLTAFQINPFIKFHGLELFGAFETAKGRTYKEADGNERKATQVSGELIYRFLKNEQMFIGGRYNSVNAAMRVGTSNVDVSLDRTAFVAGWFPTPNLLLKMEIVNQNYKDFPNTDIRYNGKFNGVTIEAVVGF